MVGGPGEEHHIVGRLTRVARPSDIDISGVRATRLIYGQVDLVLEQSGPDELGRGRALVNDGSAHVVTAVPVVGGDIGGSVHRLRSVEADESVEEPTIPIERLGRIA